MSLGLDNPRGTEPTLEDLMQMGMQAARQGNRPNARLFFQQVLDADKHNERAWLWMASVAETQEERIRFLKTVLRINPNNSVAREELERMRRRRETSNTLVLRYGLIGLALAVVLFFIVVLLLLAL
ncbi:MAG: hypothetical protein M5U29_12035 [Anaerolineae bacterium]|nr:hypothetical protein [Anaerolineae bacterium]